MFGCAHQPLPRASERTQHVVWVACRCRGHQMQVYQVQSQSDSPILIFLKMLYILKRVVWVFVFYIFKRNYFKTIDHCFFDNSANTFTILFISYNHIFHYNRNCTISPKHAAHFMPYIYIIITWCIKRFTADKRLNVHSKLYSWYSECRNLFFYAND